jgi:hypothetical protein
MAERDLRFGGIANGGGDPRIGNRHNHVRAYGRLARQQPPQHFSRLLHRTAEDDRIGTRKIDVLEDAVRLVPDRSVALARHALRADDDHLTRLDVAQVDRANQIEGARFRSEHVAHAPAGKLHLTEGERAKAVRVASDDDAVVREKHQRECAFQLQQRFAQRARESALARACDQMQDDLSIAGGLKDRPVALQIAAQFGGVGDIAVVRHRKLSLVAGHRKGLRI